MTTYTFSAANAQNPAAMAESRRRAGLGKARNRRNPRPVWWEMEAAEFEQWLKDGKPEPNAAPVTPLAAALREADLSAYEAARRIGIPESTLGHYAGGRRPLPDDVRERLRVVLGVCV